jgi:tetratricopeptide (TPR) repeat protein
MPRELVLGLAAFGLAATAPPLRAQGVAELVEAGRGLAASRPGEALRYFERALELDSLDYGANWRAAVAAVELGQEITDSAGRAARDSLYATAQRSARRAVAVDSTDPGGHFALAMALGRAALSLGRRARLHLAEEIYASARRALALAPDHDGAHHVLALWHAEAMRTSGLTRFMARNILGAKVLGQASWARAIEHLERAVELDPSRIYHRLDLARVYVDRKRHVEAREQLLAIEPLPDRVLADPRYRAEASALLQRIAVRAEAEARDRAKDRPSGR